MNLVILDTETTGLKPKEHDLIEIAAILYNVEHRQMIQCFSTLFPCENNPVEHINHISPAWTNTDYCNVGAFRMLEDMISNSNAVIAHNAQFDKSFVDVLYDGLSDDFKNTFLNSSWICTKSELKWPSNPPRLRLQDICESYGILYAHAHRALSDCNLLMNCLQKVDNLQTMIEEILQRKN